MDKRGGGKNRKEERSKLRKKLLQNGTLLEPSKFGNVPSENNSISENSIRETLEKKRHKLVGKKRKVKDVNGGVDAEKVDHLEDGSNKIKSLPDEKRIEGREEKKKRKLSKKKREKQKVSGGDVDEIDQLGVDSKDDSKKIKYGSLSTESSSSETSRTSKSARLQEADVAMTKITNESKRAGKKKRKDQISSEKVSHVIKEECGSVPSDVYHISSVDADSSKGMKKWMNAYYQSRPGLKILQERIDKYVTSHEEQLEEERKQKEELMAEDGWTVVTQQKGRKKTTDTESGTAVGGVAQAAVIDKMGRKKSKDVGVDFYGFQKKDAKRNEIMMLQSKFEQDKQKIQQLRAQRKFRPY